MTTRHRGAAAARAALTAPTGPTTGSVRSRPVRALAVVAVLAVALSGCSAVITSRGEPVTEERTISTVHAVTLEAAGRLTISIGPAPSLTITADQGVVDRITSEVRDGHLVLALPGRLVNVGSIRYDLVVPRLDELQIDGAGDVRGSLTATDELRLGISGAGDVDLDGVDVSRLVVSIDGAGDVDLAGRAEHQEVQIDGAGWYHGDDLEAVEAAVTISGTGTADVHATRTLQVQIDGAGAVTYTGDPEVTSRLDGIGRVTRR